MHLKQAKSVNWFVTVGLLLMLTAPSAFTAEVACKDIELSVIDGDTGLPIDGAEVSYYREKYSSDAEGRILLPLKIKDYGTYFYINAESYTPRRVRWRSPDPSDYPNRYTVKMRKGITIGGIVIDEADNRIQGATVTIIGTDSDMGDDRRSFDDKAFVWDQKVVTDADGRWSYELFPRSRKRVSLRPSHPDYITPAYSTSHTNIDALTEQTFELRMMKGMVLKGTVLDPDGNPVARAIVFQGANRVGSDQPETETDDSGIFSFAQVPPSNMVLTVVKPGWAPELVVVDPTSAEPIDVQLQQGHRVELTVVDPEGRPVVDAWVMPDSWREKSPGEDDGELYRSLADISRATHDAGKLRYNKHTDRQGRFVWTWAPEDRVEYAVLKPGMMSKREVSLSAAEHTRQITLYPALTIRGRVTDAETGENIEHFNVLHAYGPKTRTPNFIDAFPILGTHGLYEISFDEENDFYWVKIVAKGYAPAISDAVSLTAGEVVVDFKLEPED